MKPTRVTLEPIGAFAFVAAAAHIVLGATLVWWLVLREEPQVGESGAVLHWMAPEDFLAQTASEPPSSPSTAVKHPSPPAVAEKKAKAEDKVSAAPSAPEPDVPKAIAITPEQAAALMASIPAAEPPKPGPVQPKPLPETSPKPPAPKPPEPPKRTASTIITLTHGMPALTPAAEPKASASLLDLSLLNAQDASGPASAQVPFDKVDRAIIEAFKKHWLPPDATHPRIEQQSVQMQVAINRQGRVVSFKLVRPSGIPELDNSVQVAADKLDKIDEPLPPSYAGERYEVQINFHVE